jgi:hypothetical protein
MAVNGSHVVPAPQRYAGPTTHRPPETVDDGRPAAATGPRSGWRAVAERPRRAFAAAQLVVLLGVTAVLFPSMVLLAIVFGFRALH